MASLWSFGVEKIAEVSGKKSVRIVRVQDICFGRGVDPPPDNSLTVFVDDVLGYAVANFFPEPDSLPADWKTFFLSRDDDIELDLETHDDVDAHARESQYEAEDVAALKAGKPPWHINMLGGWPSQTGAGIRVAVLDSGIGAAIPQLPRKGDDSDFCSAVSAGAKTNDMALDSHGTLCAGIIGARMGTAPRQAVAPDCTVFAAQITTGKGTYTRMSSLLLMLSWAVHCVGARVVSMSFGASKACQTDPALCKLFSYVARRLREKNLALLFAAAEGGDTQLTFPANADGVVAVGRYKRDDTYEPCKVIGTTAKPAGFLAKTDLLFGPGGPMESFKADGSAGTLSNVSAACAFVAGVAALYFRKHPLSTVDEVFAEMRTQAVSAKDAAGKTWLCACFPQ